MNLFFVGKLENSSDNRMDERGFMSFRGVEHWMNLMQLDENEGKSLVEFQKSWTMDEISKRLGPKPMQHIYLVLRH
jgi:hypothetical protein